MRLFFTGTDFGRVASVLATGGPRIPRQLIDDLPEAARPIVRDMRSAIMSVSMTTQVRTGTAVGLRGSGGGIRGRIAAAVRARPTGNGVIIDVNTGSLGNAENLPMLIDQPGTWRHPVLGNRRAWVSQYASPTGWFTRTAKRHGATITNYQGRKARTYLDRLGAQL